MCAECREHRIESRNNFLPLLIILSEYKPLLLLLVRNGRHLSQQIKQPVMYTLFSLSLCPLFAEERAVNSPLLFASNQRSPVAPLELSYRRKEEEKEKEKVKRSESERSESTSLMVP